MPKIEAYAAFNTNAKSKNKGKVKTFIPVDIATKIEAYRCPFTEKLFADKNEYVHHLRMLRLSSNREIRRMRLFNEFVEIRNSITSLDQLPGVIEQNSDKFFENALVNSIIGEEYIKFPHQINILRISLSREDNVSNTHDCPIGGVTNWSRKPDLPRGYPGWQGSITFTVTFKGDRKGKHNYNDCSDILEGTRHSSTGGVTGLHLGSGGSGGETSRYDLKIFDADFPGLATAYGESVTYLRMAGLPDTSGEMEKWEYTSPDF